MNRTDFQLLYGRDEPPPAMQTLRAGRLQMWLDGADLRRVMWNDIHIAQRFYVQVRDPNWNTIPGTMTLRDRFVGANEFRLVFDMTHRSGAIAFDWRGELRGETDGTLHLSMSGYAQSDFPYNVIGWCVLHPQSCAGMRFRAQSSNAELRGELSGELPRYIGPQLLRDGAEVPIVPAFARLQIDFPDCTAQFNFEGDAFEIEDQRNWTDSSFKTYSLPPGARGPRRAQRGQHFQQSVTLRVVPNENVSFAPALPMRARETENNPAPVQFRVGEELGVRVPPIGLGMASHDEPLSPREIELLRVLRPAHLRVDVKLANANWRDELARALTACQQLDCALELALFLPDTNCDLDLHALAKMLDDVAVSNGHVAVEVARVLVFHDREAVTSGDSVQSARAALRATLPNVDFVGGTNVYFCDLNRNTNASASLPFCDALAYSLNPQVHANDELSLMENLAAQGETLRSARAKFGDVPLCISPITLCPRFNAVEKFADASVASDKLPSNVDARQMSLFGAAWTLGSLKALSENNAAALTLSLTFYETTGWRGVLEREVLQLPQRFPSRAGEAFPLFHVLADACEWQSAPVLKCESSDPLRAQGFAVRQRGTTSVLLSNMTPQPQLVDLVLPGLPARNARRALQTRRLNTTSAPLAGREPLAFRKSQIEIASNSVQLAPYETLRVQL